MSLVKTFNLEFCHKSHCYLRDLHCFLYMYITEVLDLIPSTTGCPMTTVRDGRRYLATVATDETTSLQGDKSDVKLQIEKGCPKQAHLMEVRTDLTNFESIIPVDECFISPIVKVLVPAETNTSSYVLRIPHCLDEDDDRTKVKVRMIHENRNPAVVIVPERAECTDGVLFYDVDPTFIQLHTKHFCLVICTICQTPYHCRERINNIWFSKFESQENASLVQKVTRLLTGLFQEKETSTQHQVEIRSFFGGVLYDIVDFRKV